MSYEPSHSRPPRQERWPNATPGEGWPAYASSGYGDAWGGRSATAEHGYGAPWEGRGAAPYQAEPTSGYWADANGYGGGDRTHPPAPGASAGAADPPPR